jgi:RHS repeat-associated protein
VQATGAVQKEYIWLDDLPVAMVIVSGSSAGIYFIHTDQLGTPQKITDSSANVVWDGVYDPFGNMVTNSGANWGSVNWGSFNWSDGSSVLTNLRFPGQYADAETGLSQNWHRDYDPTIGRYIQSDASGLLGGTNTYGYAMQSPLNVVDIDGLAPKDKTFGLPQDFWKWYHRKAKRPGDPDLTKEEAEDEYKEWCDQGKPGPDSKAKKARQSGSTDSSKSKFVPLPPQAVAPLLMIPVILRLLPLLGAL